MNDLDAQRPSPQPQQQEQEEHVEQSERRHRDVPGKLSGLEWLVRQAQRRSGPR